MKCSWLSLSLVPLISTIASPALAVSSAELYQTQAYVYGRFEARLRQAPGDGVISSFFLWKSGSEVSGTYWNELDFEKLGADCHLQTNAIYGAPSANHSQTNAVSGDLCGEYHTYTFEWTPTYIAYLVDGVELRRDTGDTATAFAENATIGMQMHFNIWPGDATFGGNFSAAILPVREYISWVKYSSYSNGTFTQEWVSDFSSGALPSGWATGNWASPKGYSTHTPANVTLTNGIAVLSLTADDATGFTGTPPADGDSTSSSSSGGATSSESASSSSAAAGGGGSSAGDSGSDNGCGCRVPASTSSKSGVALLAAAFLAVTRLRRRRGGSQP